MPEGRAGPFESCWQVAGDEPSHYMSTELHRYSYSLDGVCVCVCVCGVCACVCVRAHVCVWVSKLSKTLHLSLSTDSP